MSRGSLVVLAVAGLAVVYALAGGAYDGVIRGQFAIAAWWTLGVLAVVGLAPRTRPTRGWWLVAAGFAVFLALNLLALTATASQERTTAELARIVHHVWPLLAVALLVRRSEVPLVVGGLALGGVAVCAVAVASRLAPSVFPADVVRAGFATSRLSYPLDYWNAMGAWAAMSAAMALGLGAHAPRLPVRVAATAVVPLCLLCAYLSYSRAAVVGVAVGLLAVIGLSRNRGTAALHALGAAAGAAIAILATRSAPAVADGTGGHGGGRVLLLTIVGMALAGGVALATLRARTDARLRIAPHRARIATGVALGALVLAGVFVGRPAVHDAWQSFNRPAGRDSADPAARLTSLNGNRRNLFASAIAAGRQHPVAGVGPGTFEFWWNTDARDGEFVRDGHSLYLEQFAELGWPGLIAILWFIVALFGAGLHAWRAPPNRGEMAGPIVAALAAYAVFTVQAGVDWMWESTAVATLGLAAAGCAVAARPGPAPAPVAGRWRWATALLAAVAILIQLPPLVSLSRVRASQRFAAAGKAEAAMTAAEEAVDAAPWAATPYVQRGLLEESAGDLRHATADVLRAEQAEPDNWRHPLLLARLLAEQDDAPGAIRAYERARSLRPLSERFAQP